MKTCFTLAICTVVMAGTLCRAAEWYVAPDGNDTNPGTRAAPLKTLEAARDAIRKLKSEQPQLAGGATVWLRGGTYRITKTFELDERDSGTQNAPIVYRACENEEVRISGGREFDPAAAQPVHYQLECDGRVLQAGSTAATIPALDAAFQGLLPLRAPDVSSRTQVTVRLGLLDAGGKVLHDTAIEVDVFPRPTAAVRRIYVVGSPQGKAAQLAADLGATPVFEGVMQAGDAILIDDVPAFRKVETQVTEAVRAGARAVFLQLPQGKYPIAGGDVAVGSGDKSDVMMGVTAAGLHFVSRATGHRLVEGFRPEDFKFWYDAKLDHPAPLLRLPAFKAVGWEPILLSFNALAAGWKADGKGHWCICQIELAGRTAGNAVATIFARRLLEASSPIGR